MYDSLLARLCALGLAGLVSLSILAGIDTLAATDMAATALAQDNRTPALLSAASAAAKQAI